MLLLVIVACYCCFRLVYWYCIMVKIVDVVVLIGTAELLLSQQLEEGTNGAGCVSVVFVQNTY